MRSRVSGRAAAWGLLAAAAAVCLAAQATELTYSLHQELYGTVSAPGGIATGPRETFVDKGLPGGKDAAIVPALVSGVQPGGGAERLTFWNDGLDATVALGWDGSPVPAPPGFWVIGSNIARDGVADLVGKIPPYLAAQVDDPRVQFSTRLVRRSPDSSYGLTWPRSSAHYGRPKEYSQTARWLPGHPRT